MLHYFLKLKFYLGFKAAIQIYIDKVIFKRQIRVPFLKHKITINHNNFADNQTFNEVILKKGYDNLIGDKLAVKRIVDLGSNIGLSAASFLSEYPNATVVVVEPESSNLKLLKQNLQPYINDGREVILYEAPVYSKEMELKIQDNNRGSNGFTVSETTTENIKSLQSIQSITINKIFENAGWDKVDMIKIDIEGAEYELLQENTEWLQKTKYLIVETHDRFKPNSTKQVFKTLESYNYSVRVLEDNLFVIFD